MANLKSGYVSYLLRLRRVQSHHRHIWAVSLECTTTGERRNFSGVNALVDFLQTEFSGKEAGLNSDQPFDLIPDPAIADDEDEKEWLLPL